MVFVFRLTNCDNVWFNFLFNPGKTWSFIGEFTESEKKKQSNPRKVLVFFNMLTDKSVIFCQKGCRSGHDRKRYWRSSGVCWHQEQSSLVPVLNLSINTGGIDWMDECQRHLFNLACDEILSRPGLLWCCSSVMLHQIASHFFPVGKEVCTYFQDSSVPLDLNRRLTRRMLVEPGPRWGNSTSSFPM